jgi:hypothetical protein
MNASTPAWDHERLPTGDLDHLLRRRGHRREKGERLTGVAVHRRGVDLEPARQVRVGLALAQVGHHQQRLAAG